MILTQYPNQLEQLLLNADQSLYTVKNLSSQEGIRQISYQNSEFDERDTKGISILNPQVLLGTYAHIKSDYYLIYYNQIWNIDQEDIIIKKFYNIRAIYKLIVKETVEEQILFLQHLQSKQKDREGVLQNYNLLKTILNYQQQ